MREFELFEINKAKCPVCGSRNKIYTELLDWNTKHHIGYTLKCCHCGNFKEFFNEHESNGNIPSSPHPRAISGEQKCFQHAFCPHTDCKLYQFGKGDNKKEPIVLNKKEEEKKYPYCQGTVVVERHDIPKFL